MRAAAGGLLALTLLRLAVAAVTPLAPDEAYYWVWSRALAPGYLDHPPMVALWIRAGTEVFGASPLGVRLLGPLSVALASWMLADTAERMFPGRRAGLNAALLLNATLLVGVGSVIMTPDTPLLFFWTAAIWALARLLTGRGGAFSGAWWLAAGVFAGCASTSKYTGALLWLGIGLWLLVSPAVRPWIFRVSPWAGAILGGLIFLPVVWWNEAHGWAGFLRQGGRVSDWRPERAAAFLAELLGGQIGLVTPGIWLLCVAGLLLAARRSWRTRDPVWTLLACLSLPAVLIFTQHAIGDRVQGNWPAIIYPAAVIAAAALVTPPWPRLRVPSAVLGFAITGLVYLQAITGLIPLPPTKDPTARLAGWDALAAAVEAARREAGAEFVVADSYALAAELAWTLPPGIRVVSTERRWHFTALPIVPLDGVPGLLVHPFRAGDPDPSLAAEPRGEVVRSRGNEMIERYTLFRAVRIPAAAELPRP